MTENENAAYIAVRAAVAELGIAPDSYGPTLNTAASPSAVRVVAAALAARLAGAGVDRVVVWNSSDEAVLAHAVAVELGVGVSRIDAVEGAVAVNPPLAAGSSAALLATSWQSRGLATARSIVDRQAGVAAIAAVSHSPALDEDLGVPVVHLLPESR